MSTKHVLKMPCATEDCWVQTSDTWNVDPAISSYILMQKEGTVDPKQIDLVSSIEMWLNMICNWMCRGRKVWDVEIKPFAKMPRLGLACIWKLCSNLQEGRTTRHLRFYSTFNNTSVAYEMRFELAATPSLFLSVKGFLAKKNIFCMKLCILIVRYWLEDGT